MKITYMPEGYNPSKNVQHVHNGWIIPSVHPGTELYQLWRNTRGDTSEHDIVVAHTIENIVWVNFGVRIIEAVKTPSFWFLKPYGDWSLLINKDHFQNLEIDLQKQCRLSRRGWIIVNDTDADIHKQMYTKKHAKFQIGEKVILTEPDDLYSVCIVKDIDKGFGDNLDYTLEIIGGTKYPPDEYGRYDTTEKRLQPYSEEYET